MIIFYFNGLCFILFYAYDLLVITKKLKRVLNNLFINKYKLLLLLLFYFWKNKPQTGDLEEELSGGHVTKDEVKMGKSVKRESVRMTRGGVIVGGSKGEQKMKSSFVSSGAAHHNKEWIYGQYRKRQIFRSSICRRVSLTPFTPSFSPPSDGPRSSRRLWSTALHSATLSCIVIKRTTLGPPS